MLGRLWNLFRRRRSTRISRRNSVFTWSRSKPSTGPRAFGEEARRAVRRDFGAMAQIEESYQIEGDSNARYFVERHSVQSARHPATPVVTLAVIATLAIGIAPIRRFSASSTQFLSSRCPIRTRTD